MSKRTAISLALVSHIFFGAEAYGETARIGFRHTLSPEPPNRPSWIGETGNGEFLVFAESGTNAFDSYGRRNLLRLRADGSIQPLDIFRFQGTPEGKPVRSPDGNFYATTSYGGDYGGGSIVRMAPDGTLSTIYSFTQLSFPSQDPLILGANGVIYGTTFTNQRQFFTIAPGGVVTTGIQTALSVRPLAAGTDGTVYGADVRQDGGKYNAVLTTSSGVDLINLTVAADLESPDALVVSRGMLVGLAPNSPNNRCALFRVALDGSQFEVLRTFAPVKAYYSACGRSPRLLEGIDGAVYGSAGAEIFRLDPSGRYGTLHVFTGGMDGSEPTYLTAASSGVLWGTTDDAGLYGGGSIFTVTTAAVKRTVYWFLGGNTDGANPVAPLVAAADGNLYGTASIGGSFGLGTVFRLSRSGQFTLLYAFTGPADGGYPSGLTVGPDGAMYGITHSVDGSAGAIFKLTTSGTVTIVARLPAGETSSGVPLVVGRDGFLYGYKQKNENTIFGPFDLFRFRLSGAVELVRTLAFADGVNGFAFSLLGGADGNLYGTTQVCSYCGGEPSAFRVTPGGQLTVFPRSSSADYFGGGRLLQARDGTIYISGSGLYSITAAGTIARQPTPWLGRGQLESLRLFSQSDDGSFVGIASAYSQTERRSLAFIVRRDSNGNVRPIYRSSYPETYANLVDGNDGRLYVTTAYDGLYAQGTIFQLVLGERPPSRGDADGDGRADITVFRPSGGGATWFVRTSANGSTVAYQWGLSSDVPVPGDYDGDGRGDIAVYRRSNGTWYVLTSSSNFTHSFAAVWGAPGDMPVPQDYDGDSVTDMAVFRAATGMWFVRGLGSVAFGAAGDVPVPGDYAGTGMAQFAVYRRGTWIVRGGGDPIQWGTVGDMPVPADYDGDGVLDIAVYRPAAGRWFVFDRFSIAFGALGDLPVPQDFDGDGRADLVVDRPSTGEWFAYAPYTSASMSLGFGAPGDAPALAAWLRTPVDADLDGDRRADLTVFRPSDGTWHSIVSSSDFAAGPAASFGATGDVPMLADFNGTHRAQRAVFRQGTWFIEGRAPVQWGSAGDRPVAADYDGDGRLDIAVYRSGQWWALYSSLNFVPTGSPLALWGSGADVPVPADYDGDGKADPAVYRDGVWSIQFSGADYAPAAPLAFGDVGDIAVPGDYDGDNRADLAVYRPANGAWFIRRSSDGVTMSAGFGGDSSDIPVPADYDGDARTDLAIFRSATGTWFFRTQFVGVYSLSIGAPGDVPVLRRP